MGVECLRTTLLISCVQISRIQLLSELANEACFSKNPLRQVYSLISCMVYLRKSNVWKVFVYILQTACIVYTAGATCMKFNPGLSHDFMKSIKYLTYYSQKARLNCPVMLSIPTTHANAYGNNKSRLRQCIIQISRLYQRNAVKFVSVR